MSYLLVLDTSNYQRRFYFRIESDMGFGWCKLRCYAIQDGDQPIEYYNPDIHQESHYMGGLWTARYKTTYQRTKQCMYLVNAFGNKNKIFLQKCAGV